MVDNMRRMLVPLTVGPTVELTQSDMIIPRLVERISELEGKLYNAKTTNQPPEGSLAQRFQTVLGAFDSSLNYILGNDTQQQELMREATDTALMITLGKTRELKSQADTLASQLQQTQNELATALAACEEAALRKQEATTALENERITHAAEMNTLEGELSEWRQRAESAMGAAQGIAIEAEAARSARVSATHDLHALRSKLADVQQLAEDFQTRFLAERAERRRLHEELQALRGNIRVVCRVRPPLTHQQSPISAPLAVSFPFEAAIRVHASERRQQEFEFSAVFDPTTSQERVFAEVWPALQSCADGYNFTLLAFGQTGGGKTHTVLGGEYREEIIGTNNNGGLEGSDAGITPRALHALFDILSKEARDDPLLQPRCVQVSMLEIYNETVRDLLCGKGTPKNTLEVSALGPFTPEQVATGAERVSGRTWCSASTAEEALTVLQEGSRERATASTALNSCSSRSHALLCLKIVDPSGAVPSSMLHLVDLAGSERVAKSEAGGQQLKEAQAINKSLSALGDVVASLQERSSHIPFRNSKLTAALQDSLAGSSKVLLVCCVAPEEESASETLSTLGFASRAAQTELGPARRVGGGKQQQQVRGGGGGSSPIATVKTPSPLAARSSNHPVYGTPTHNKSPKHA